MISILVADDHPLLRNGIIRILGEQTDMRVVGEAANAAQAVEALANADVDILVLDLNMPDRSGFEVLGQLATWPRRPKVLVLSAHPEEQFALRVLKAGASGYMNKEAAPDALVKAIRRIHGGGRYISAAVAEQLADAISPGADRPRHLGLSPREFQVFRLIATGSRVPVICQQLSLSPSTVHTVRRRVLGKLGLTSDVDLARYAVQNALLGEDRLRTPFDGLPIQ